MVFPTSHAVVHDNWEVAGFKRTGSNDFSVANLFVPEMFTSDRVAAQNPKRAGELYRLGLPGFF